MATVTLLTSLEPPEAATSTSLLVWEAETCIPQIFQVAYQLNYNPYRYLLLLFYILIQKIA